ncbi:MAG: hypothetical protein AAB916_02150 [Patescibacteria group bacterium]
MRGIVVWSLVAVAGLTSIGCAARGAPITQVVCTRPELREKKVLMMVASVATGDSTSERFTGAVESSVQMWLRGRGVRTVDVPPHDYSVFARVVSVPSGEPTSGSVSINLKMFTGDEVVANGDGIVVYGSGAGTGMLSDVQAAGQAARRAAENLCMTREREYIQYSVVPPQVYQPVPLAPSSDPGHSGYYGYSVEYAYPGPVYRGSVYVSPRAHAGWHHHRGEIHLPLPLPLLIYKAIKGDGGTHHRDRHHRGRDPRHPRSPRR